MLSKVIHLPSLFLLGGLVPLLVLLLVNSYFHHFPMATLQAGGGGGDHESSGSEGNWDWRGMVDGLYLIMKHNYVLGSLLYQISENQPRSISKQAFWGSHPCLKSCSLSWIIG